MKQIIFITLTCLLFANISLTQTVTTLSNTGTGINDAIIVLNDGTLIGSDHMGTSVFKIPVGGTPESIAGGINSPNGLEIDDEGNIYIGAPKEDKIYMLNTSGELSEYISNVLNPNNIIWEYGTDNFIVASYVHSKILRVTPEETVTTLFEGSPLNGPLGMTYDSNNILYIGNFTDGKIFKVENEQLNYFAEIPSADIGGLFAAIGFLKYINGYFYATGFGTNKIYRISTEGVVESIAGSGFAGTRDGNASSAEFYWTNGLAGNAAGDTLYISDYQTHAVRILTGFVTSTEDDNQQIPTDYELSQNYPNPFNPSTAIKYSVPVVDANFAPTTHVILKVFDMLGREVATLVNEHQSAGTYEVEFDGSNLSSGAYFYKLTSGDFTSVKKLLLMK